MMHDIYIYIYVYFYNIMAKFNISIPSPLNDRVTYDMIGESHIVETCYPKSKRRCIENAGDQQHRTWRHNEGIC